MKKVILPMMVMLLPSAVLAEQSGMSVGVEYLSSSNTFTAEYKGASVDLDDDSSAVGISLGLPQSNNGQWFIAYQKESFDRGVYDSNNEDLNYFSLGYTKRFPLNGGIFPYIKGSLGYGTMDVEGFSESSADVVGLKVGVGLSFSLAPNAELLAGLDFQGRSWSSLSDGQGNEMEISDSSTTGNIGLAYYF